MPNIATDFCDPAYDDHTMGGLLVFRRVHDFDLLKFPLGAPLKQSQDMQFGELEG